MTDDRIRRELDELRSQVRDLAHENRELREMMSRGAVPDVRPGPAPVPWDAPTGETLAAAAAVGLSPEELKRRRRKARRIAGALVGLGVGIGLSLLFGRDARHADAPEPTAVTAPAIPAIPAVPAPPPPPPPGGQSPRTQ